MYRYYTRKVVIGISEKPRFILGIDPSLSGTGYCILDCKNKKKYPKLVETGVVRGRNKTWRDETTQVKLSLIQSKIKEIISKYRPLYKNIFIERGFTRFNNDTQAIFKARGAIEAELVEYNIVEISPREVKKIITGRGDASKEEVKTTLTQMLGVDESVFITDDASDATAVALSGYLLYIRPYEEDREVSNH